MIDTGDETSAQASVLARAASGLSLLACVGAAFAFLREVVLAAAFGAGASVDAYLVAVVVPFVLGASMISTLEAVFIPIYLSSKTEGGVARATRFADATHLWLLIGGVLLTVALYAAVPFLLPLQAPGFSPAQIRTATSLAWFTVPSVLFTGLYALGRSILNAERRFLFPALAPGVSACVTIIVIFYGRRALGIRAAAIGYTAGMAALWLTVYIPIILAKLPGRGFAGDWRNSDVLQIPRAAGALLVGVLATSVIPVVDRFMASRFPAGVISALAYADRVNQVPITIVATSVMTATFPTLSRHAAKRDLSGLRRTFLVSIQLTSLLLVPIAVLLIVLSRDIVAVLFERGQFTASDAHTTAIAVAGLAIGLAFMGVFQVVPRAFNALRLASFVALSGLLNLVFKTAFNLLFVPTMGYVGFALATSAMYATTGGIMLWLLHRRMEGLELKTILPVVRAIFTGAALMAVVGGGVAWLLQASAPLIRVLLVSCVATSAYVGTVWLVSGRPTGLLEWIRDRPVASGESLGEARVAKP